MGHCMVQHRANPRARRRGALLRVSAFAALSTSPAVALATPAIPTHPPLAAFQAHMSTVSGIVSRVGTSPTTETITIGSSTATLNWSPFDQQIGGGAIDFLPSGNVATFTSASGITDYTVLNRIVPTDATRAISLNGQVISTLQGTHATGGRIWFYSPGGIVVG